MIKDKLKLYCVYHDKKFVTEYTHNKPWFNSYYKPLVESDWFKPYYTHEGHSNSLDLLQRLFCEVTAIYYIYKNNLKSEYVGICHYDRQQLRHLIEEGTYTNENLHFIGHLCDKWNYYDCMKDRFVNFLYNDIREYILANYNTDSRIYKYFITNEHENVEWLSNMCFICKWEYFEELAGFISNFIDWHMAKRNLNYDETRILQYINDNFVAKKNWKHLPECELWLVGNTHRVYGYVIEMLVGWYFGNISHELNNNEFFNM